MKYLFLQIGFLGTRGLGYSGDIALDDIMVTSGFCPDEAVATTTEPWMENNEVF